MRAVSRVRHHLLDLENTGSARPDTLSSLHPEVPASTALYVAHVLLERSGPERVREATPDDVRRGPDIERICRAVSEILQRLPAHLALRNGAGESSDPFVECAPTCTPTI